MNQLRKIILAVHSSPQRRKTWLELVADSLRKKNPNATTYELALMLILDVKTRWSSTYQMMRKFLTFSLMLFQTHIKLGHALRYKTEINMFVMLNQDLHSLEISNEEWDAISLVTTWLKHFRDATTQTSSTKQPMLSQTHAIFCHLQKHLCNALHKLPNDAPPRIQNGLVATHKSSPIIIQSMIFPHITFGQLVSEVLPQIGFILIKF